MAVKKSVAAPVASDRGSNPETALPTSELEASSEVTATQTETVEETVSHTADTEILKAKRIAGLAKARAAKAARLAEAQEEIDAVKAALAAKDRSDKYSFGTIKEVPKSIPTPEEYVRVEMPLKDIFDHAHPGVQLNRHKFEPGKTYMLRGDVAKEVRTRLAMFHDEQVRLLRPNADRKALADVNRGSSWTSRGGTVSAFEDVVPADTKILTVEF